jgi:hypothetical protein
VVLNPTFIVDIGLGFRINDAADGAEVLAII